MSEHFHERDKIDGEWLSPVKTEREWQEQKLVEIFGHYPNACPKWQYLNGLIHIALEHVELTKKQQVSKIYTEKDLRSAIFMAQEWKSIVKSGGNQWIDYKYHFQEIIQSIDQSKQEQ